MSAATLLPPPPAPASVSPATSSLAAQSQGADAGRSVQARTERSARARLDERTGIMMQSDAEEGSPMASPSWKVSSAALRVCSACASKPGHVTDGLVTDGLGTDGLGIDGLGIDGGDRTSEVAGGVGRANCRSCA